jgi:hypothetical protein
VADWVVAGKCGPLADGIRRAMADNIESRLAPLHHSPDYLLENPGADPAASHLAFYSHRASNLVPYLITTRPEAFTQYHQVLKGSKPDWDALAILAWKRMGGQPRIGAHPILTHQAATMPDLYESYSSMLETPAQSQTPE